MKILLLKIDVKKKNGGKFEIVHFIRSAQNIQGEPCQSTLNCPTEKTVAENNENCRKILRLKFRQIHEIRRNIGHCFVYLFSLNKCI